MENVIKTTHVNFDIEQKPLSAHITAIIAEDKSVKSVSITSIMHQDGTYIGDLNLTADMIAENSTLARFVAEIMNAVNSYRNEN